MWNRNASRLALTLALPAALVAAVPASPARADSEPASVVERSDRDADVRGLAGLDVDNSRGQVTLLPSPDGRLRVTAIRIVRMGNDAEARKYAAETTVECGPRGNRYVVAVHYPRRIETGFSLFDAFTVRGRHRFQMPQIEVRLEVKVPPGLASTVTTASGDVTASALGSGLRVNTASGDVSLADLKSARVRTASGDVEARQVGAFDCGTASGDVQVDDARDSLAISTQSGDVTVMGAPAGAHAHTVSGELNVRGAGGHVALGTVSGDLQARLLAPLASAELSSVSGEVEVELAAGMGANLSARTVSGSIDCGAGAVLLKHDRNSLEARIGRGGPPIRISSTSGNLTVTSGGK